MLVTIFINVAYFTLFSGDVRVFEMLWHSRINWLEYGFATERDERERKARINGWMKRNRPPTDPPDPEQQSQADGEWQVQFREMLETVFPDYPPAVTECILIVNSTGEVVAAISKNRDAELHLTGRA